MSIPLIIYCLYLERLHYTETVSNIYIMLLPSLISITCVSWQHVIFSLFISQDVRVYLYIFLPVLQIWFNRKWSPFKSDRLLKVRIWLLKDFFLCDLTPPRRDAEVKIWKYICISFALSFFVNEILTIHYFKWHQHVLNT